MVMTNPYPQFCLYIVQHVRLLSVIHYLNCYFNQLLFIILSLNCHKDIITENPFQIYTIQ